MACPDIDTLAACAEGRLALAHLASCRGCREEVEALKEELAQGAPSPIEPQDAAAWKTVALGAAAKPRPIWRALPWAAAVLIAAGVWLARSEPPVRKDVPAPPAAAQAPAWLLEEGFFGEGPFLLQGAVLGVAGQGARLKADDAGLTLGRGEVCVEVPAGITCRLAAEGGAVEVSGGAAWAGIQGSPTAFLSEAYAGESVFRVWIASGRMTLIPGREEVAAPALAEFSGGRWKLTPGADLSDRLEKLKAAIRKPGQAVPPEGVLIVRMNRPPSQTEVGLAFPQPGGSRTWLLGDWASRGFGETATFSVAFGPWGARGYVNGKRAWAMGAGEPARALPPAPAGVAIGVTAAGSKVAVQEERVIPW